MRLSVFHKYLIYFTAIITLVVFTLIYPPESRFIFYGMLYGEILLFLAGLIWLSMDIHLPIRYKITQQGNRYEAKVLILLPVLFWQHVRENHRFEDDMVLGTSIKRAIHWGVGYNSFYDAVQAIDAHKKESKERIKRVFVRPGKRVEKVSYL